MSAAVMERADVDVFADRPCPDWCRWKDGHTTDELRDTGPARSHEGPHFGEYVTVYAEEHAYKGGTVDTPVVTVIFSDDTEMLDLSSVAAAEFAVDLVKASAFIAGLVTA